jgi:L-asparaginase
MKKRILMLTTGGTIACAPTANGLAPTLSSDELLGYVREFETVCDIEAQAVYRIDSTDVTFDHWLTLARTLQAAYAQYDAFLICHGTDTMAYTAAALSYLLQNCAKPILLTGAQKSILMEITDAKKNLRDAVLCALHPQTHGVCIVFDGNIIAGTRAKKTSTFSYNAFSSINFPVLGQVRDDRVLYYLPPAVHNTPPRFYTALDANIFLWKLTPGVSPKIIPAMVDAYDGIIVESFGVGGLPASISDALCSALATYAPHEKVLAIATQVTYEGSAVDTYAVGSRVRQSTAFLETYDMTLEAAFTKLAWAMAQKPTSRAALEALFYTPVNYDLFAPPETKSI